jgi:hypothetical protein
MIFSRSLNPYQSKSKTMSVDMIVSKIGTTAYITSKIAMASGWFPVYAYHGVLSEGVLQEIARLARAN